MEIVMLKRLSALFWPGLVCVLLLIACILPVWSDDPDIMYQTGVIDALLAGVYDGTTTCGDLLDHGDLGIGTFNALDGEMVLLGETVYQIRADGSVHAMPKQAKTPFAEVTFFQDDQSVTLTDVTSLKDFFQRLQQKLPGKNLIYAVKITGVFDHITTRSVPKQQKPYQPLADVVQKQSIFEFDNAAGDIVGFYCPVFMQKINAPGFHFHFLSKDKKTGGHLLDVQAKHLTIALDLTDKVILKLPTSKAAHEVNYNKDASEALNKVEK